MRVKKLAPVIGLYILTLALVVIGVMIMEHFKIVASRTYNGFPYRLSMVLVNAAIYITVFIRIILDVNIKERGIAVVNAVLLCASIAFCVVNYRLVLRYDTYPLLMLCADAVCLCCGVGSRGKHT